MPEMEGVRFLAKAREIHPDVRRFLLTAYADTSAAISAINEVRLHHYLIKPWDPPEQNLYPVLDDLLADWHAEYAPPFRGIRVVGQRWSPEAHRIKDFLGRHHVPFRWVDAATQRCYHFSRKAANYRSSSFPIKAAKTVPTRKPWLNGSVSTPKPTQTFTI